jgi:leader peptidase (prepilin peptidase)/N-methyltransferase
LLSFILLRGKCRYCRESIPAQYLLVEIITPILWMLVFLKWEFSMQTLSGVVLTAILVASAFTDINEGIIPDTLSFTGLLLGLGLGFATIGIKQSLLGAMGFGLIFLFIALISRGGMGGGDIKLAALIGAFTGFPGALMVILISSWLGALWAVVLLIQGRAGLKTAIKFAPFLAIAAWLVWMYQIELISFYPMTNSL